MGPSSTTTSNSTAAASSTEPTEDNTPKIGSVLVAKLTSGADLIGIVGDVDEEDGIITLGRPHMLQVVPTPKGMALNMIPLHVFAANPQSDTWEIELHYIQYLAIYPPAQQIEDQFKEMLTGIVIARGSVIQPA